MSLPSNIIRHRWVRVSAFPARNRIGRRSVIVDRCWTMDGRPHSVHVAYVADHPFLATLDRLAHVPRAVKALYRGEVRLKHLMSPDAFVTLADWQRAREAWAAWAQNSKAA